jgi:hypothetical protein
MEKLKILMFVMSRVDLLCWSGHHSVQTGGERRLDSLCCIMFDSRITLDCSASERQPENKVRVAG